MASTYKKRSMRSALLQVFRRARFKLFFFVVPIFYLWLIAKASFPLLPSAENPLLFYSNQMRQDIKSIFSHTLKNSENSLFLSVYGITDPDIIHLLERKAEGGVAVKIEYDPTASSALQRLIPHGEILPIASKGLMHQKILSADGNTLLLGSANLTTASLRHHNNLVVGIHHPGLCAFVQNPEGSSFPFSIQNQKGELFLLPDLESKSLKALISALASAERSIKIAMFTFTHPAIVKALISAKERGVNVQVAVDYYTAKGASRKAVQQIQNEGIRVHLSQGRELLHYKWGWIDEKVLVTGSANWTKSAFSKNQDFLLFLYNLNNKQNHFLNSLWKIIEIESTLML